MSMICCERCDMPIDSDDDPECFVEVPWLNMAERVWCESCREAEWTENEDAEPALSPDNSTRS